MREHTLSSTGGLTYAQMGRFQSADDPGDAAGTNDEAEAARTRRARLERRAQHLGHRDRADDGAEHGVHVRDISVFSIVVGIALLLTGIGLVILAVAVFGRGQPVEQAPAPAAVPGGAPA